MRCKLVLDIKYISANVISLCDVIRTCDTKHHIWQKKYVIRIFFFFTKGKKYERMFTHRKRITNRYARCTDAKLKDHLAPILSSRNTRCRKCFPFSKYHLIQKEENVPHCHRYRCNCAKGKHKQRNASDTLMIMVSNNIFVRISPDFHRVLFKIYVSQPAYVANVQIM